MKISFARPNHNDLPPSSECELGDLAMLTGGDIFCYMGDHWKMMGGRWVDPNIKQTFLNYIQSGWPDCKTLNWDLETMFDLSVFETVTDFRHELSKNIASNPIWNQKFKEEIMKTCKLLESRKRSQEVQI